MWISAACSSAPKIEAEKSLPLRPSVVLHPAPVGGDEAGDDQRPVKIGRELPGKIGARLRPLDARPPGAAVDEHHAARIHPLHGPCAPPALGEKALEQSRGPDLPVAGNQIADGAGGRARQLDRVQYPQKILTFAVKTAEIGLRGRRREHLLGDGRVARAQLRELSAIAAVLSLGERHEAQQRIRDPLAGGQHHGQAGGRSSFENGRHLAEAVGVGDARAPELVHDPGIGLAHRNRISRP